MTRSLGSSIGRKVLVLAGATLVLSACMERWDEPTPLVTEFQQLKLAKAQTEFQACYAWTPKLQAPAPVTEVTLGTPDGWQGASWFLADADSPVAGKNGLFDCYYRIKDGKLTIKKRLKVSKPGAAKLTPLFKETEGTKSYVLTGPTQVAPKQTFIAIGTVKNQTKAGLPGTVSVTLKTAGAPITGTNDVMLPPRQATDVTRCVVWDPGIDKLEIHAVTLVSGGGWQGSNWYTIPAEKVKGQKGYFDCETAGIDAKKPLEAGAASLFQQSVQPIAGTPQRFELPKLLYLKKGQVLLGVVKVTNDTLLPAETGVSITLHIGNPLADGHDGNYWMPASASTMAKDVDALYYAILALCIFFFVAITGVTVYFVWKYRWTPGHEPEPSPSHHDGMEITWTVIPSIIVVIIFVAGWRGYINLATPPRHALEIKVTAQKWSWLFEHPAVDGEVVSDNVLHVPVNRPVRVVMRAKDVLHALYIPAFRVKQDIVPGRYTKLWFTPTRPGVYRLFCAEYCGLDHSQMKTRVIVHAPGGYERYIAQQLDEASNIPPALLGEKLYNQRGCAGCHSLDGSPLAGPTFKGLFGKNEPLTSGSVLVDENYLRESILDPAAKVVKGFQPVMPSFKGQLSDKQLDGLIEYLKTIK